MTDVNQLIKEALLAKDKIALNAYKNLKTELQKVLTAKNAPEYSEALFMQVIAKYAKSLEDAILQFSEAHRDDLVASYTSELEVVKKLLPEPATISEIMLSIWDWAGDNGFLEPTDSNPNNFQTLRIPKKEMGNVIKHLKSKHPTTDGKKISEIAKKYLV